MWSKDFERRRYRVTPGSIHLSRTHDPRMDRYQNKRDDDEATAGAGLETRADYRSRARAMQQPEEEEGGGGGGEE